MNSKMVVVVFGSSLIHTYKNPQRIIDVSRRNQHTGNRFGIILRNRTVHTVIIVLEQHMYYIT